MSTRNDGKTPSSAAAADAPKNEIVRARAKHIAPSRRAASPAGEQEVAPHTSGEQDLRRSTEGPPEDADDGMIEVVIPAPSVALAADAESNVRYPVYVRLPDSASAVRATRAALTPISADLTALPGASILQAAGVVAIERRAALHRLRVALEQEDERAALLAAGELVGIR